jgi:transcription termination/antitermination protein NusA
MFFWLRKAAKPVQAQKAGAPADRAGDALTSRCGELGVEVALSEIAGISLSMLVALAENGIKTVEDLAGCATDDLHGWVEQTSGTTMRHAGVLDGFGLSRDECGAIIMKARARVGWIAESNPPQPAKAG